MNSAFLAMAAANLAMHCASKASASGDDELTAGQAFVVGLLAGCILGILAAAATLVFA